MYTVKNLADYIKNNQMVYQQVDGLIEVGSKEDSLMLSSLVEQNGFTIANRDELIEDGWEIADWSIDTDTLIFIGEYVVCITDIMKKEISSLE